MVAYLHTLYHRMSGQILEESRKAAALGVVSRMKNELHSLRDREAELANRILLLWRTIDGLASLANLRQIGEMSMQVREESEQQGGLIESCASLLRTSPYPLTIGEICSSLKRERRLEKVQTEDELFAVWQSLKRLLDDGLVQVSQTSGIRRWLWAEPRIPEPNLRAPAAELLADIHPIGTLGNAAPHP